MNNDPITLAKHTHTHKTTRFQFLYKIIRGKTNECYNAQEIKKTQLVFMHIIFTVSICMCVYLYLSIYISFGLPFFFYNYLHI